MAVSEAGEDERKNIEKQFETMKKKLEAKQKRIQEKIIIQKQKIEKEEPPKVEGNYFEK